MDHYGPLIFDRLAKHLRGTDKIVDVAVFRVSNAGKSTLCRWLELALPGIAVTLDGSDAFSGQALRFTAIGRRLVRYRLVLIDEADKMTERPHPAALNSLTAPTVRIEHKGQDDDYQERIGTAFFIGADYPNLNSSRPGVRNARVVGVRPAG